jgi:signal transduction histidine kinase
MQSSEPILQLSAMEPMPIAFPLASSTPADAAPTRETFAALAHDARNMLAALDLYCDLLAEPGVLSHSHQHYGKELKMIATSSRRLVEKMGALGIQPHSGALGRGILPAGALDAEAETWPVPQPPRRWKELPEVPISNLAEELRGCQNLLAALAGTSIQVAFEICECALPVEMTGEDLTRVLVNLVKNASEAMTGEGRIRIGLREYPTETGTNRRVTLTVEDNGPGIPRDALEAVFEPGYTTRGVGHEGSTPGPWPVVHRGMGLTIAQSIVRKAGGSIHAAVRDPSGTCFQIELPVKTMA